MVTMHRATREEINMHLHNLGVRPGDRLVVHSRLLSFGAIEGGVATIFEALLEAVGATGTLAFPGYTLEGSSERTFDPKTTAPIGAGALSTYVFKMDNRIRSGCPLHNHMLVGKDADMILAADPTISFGPGSDFEILEKNGFKLLLLGCLPSAGATFLHHMEALSEVPYRHWLHLVRKRHIGGRVVELSVRYFANRTEDWAENFDVILPRLEEANALTKAPTAYAESYLASLAAVKDVTRKMIQDNPFALVTRRPSNSQFKDLYPKEYFDERVLDHQRRQIMYDQEIQRIHKITGLSGGRLLDIGCGPGDFAKRFGGDVWELYGTEVSEFAILEAEKKGIRFDLPNLAEPFFDLIIYRGTIQHLPMPFESMFDSFARLKKGGWIVFLATPNIGGIVYRLWQDHPALEPKYNFGLFSDKIIKSTLENIGFKNLQFYFPYIDSPYASPIKDHWKFICRLLTGIPLKFAFWKNMMECYAQK